ncbi:MAG: HNH endonuclease [Azospirillaceae bacterium]|nr:HNH endonuclease [Azospirillaceae bacterium]
MLNLQTLVLNADFRPLSMFPLSSWHWKDAVTAIILDRVSLVAEYDEVIHSPRMTMRVPSVVALKHYQPWSGFPAFTRYNIFCRDGWVCQYCGEPFSAHELTFDHVVPRSRGGRTTWENVVSACSPCNLIKGNKTPIEAGMPVLREPRRPTRRELAFASAPHLHEAVHHSWADFLYWDSELEE